MSPEIQEPDDRFWTPLRAVFVALLVAALLFLGTREFVPAATPPTDASDAAPVSASPPPPKTEYP